MLFAHVVYISLLALVFCGITQVLFESSEFVEGEGSLTELACMTLFCLVNKRLENSWDMHSFKTLSVSCQFPTARKLFIKELGLHKVTVFPVYCSDSSLKCDLP